MAREVVLKQAASRLGQIWVLTIFAATAGGLAFLEYDSDNPLVHQVSVAAAAALVTFALIAVLFWLCQLTTVSIPAGWHVQRGFENRAFYRRLGVPRFRAGLLRSPFRTLNVDVHLTDRSLTGLAELDRRMRQAEANHVIAFVLTLVATVFYAANADPWFAVWLTGLNVVGNVYPVLLQRYNRLRLAPVVRRASRR